jgi:hypothetical protein
MVERDLPTVEQIIERYSPKLKQFEGLEAVVSINENGKIVYIVPQSTVRISNQTPGLTPEATE